VLLTTRIPEELRIELKIRAIRSTLQILTEHALTLYMGERLPPDLLGGYDWPEDNQTEPEEAGLARKLSAFSVRIPRSTLRRMQIWAVKAEVPEQELVERAFRSYVMKGMIPPKREEARRDEFGRLLVKEPLLADEFEGYTLEQRLSALRILVKRHNQYGGPLASKSSGAALGRKGTPKFDQRLTPPTTARRRYSWRSTATRLARVPERKL
jgi:hypothetical protein